MKEKLKVGETLTLRVEELTPRGHGVASFAGQPIVVKETLPGDQVQAQLTRVRPPLWEARLIKVEAQAPERIVPRCPHFGPCGGCDLQHLSYSAQVDWKRQALNEVLKKEAGLFPLPEIPVVSMEDPWDYRSKMEFSFGQEGDRILLGLHERGSFQRIVNVEHCSIAVRAVSDLLMAIRETAGRFALKAYNPKIHQGFWRYAVVRISRDTGKLMLLLVTNEGPREPIDALREALPSKVPALKSFYWGLTTRVSDVAVPERMSLVWGSEVLEDRVGEIRFEVGPMNFVQPNLELTPRIYVGIQEKAALTGREAVYDLYCGIGLIALSLANSAKAVYGVESEPENVACAERNAKTNQILNATFLCGKVEDLLKGRSLFKAGPKPDLIIVDPPRAGLHKEVYAPLLTAQAPTLLYLSCNPTTLSRDLKILLARDPQLQVEEIQLFDFFPHTVHMEVLVTLRRKI